MHRIEAISFAELEYRVSSIMKEIDNLKSAIKHKRAEIDSISDFLANSLVDSVADRIKFAEGNPAEMKKYVNRFISKIVVHLSNHYYTILEIKPKKYMGTTKSQSIAVPVIDEDEDGNIIDGGYKVVQVNDMKFEVNDSDYIVIAKKKKFAYAIDITIQAHSV